MDLKILLLLTELSQPPHNTSPIFAKNFASEHAAISLKTIGGRAYLPFTPNQNE
jgi:hypothetical protein